MANSSSSAAVKVPTITLSNPNAVASHSALRSVTEPPLEVVSTSAVSNNTWPPPVQRDGVVFDKWPFRLDISTEYQDWILVGVSVILVMLWCLPCICGKMRNSMARGFTKCIYTRLNVFFWTITYINLVILMLTIGVMPNWTVDEYLDYMLKFITWVLIHLRKIMTSGAIVVCFFLVVRFQEKIRVAAGLDHITVIHFNWRDMLFSSKKRPVELFIWKVEDLHGSSGKIYKPNDVFVECHLGDNEPMRTRVHNNAGTSCVIKESFQMNINESESSSLMTLLVKDQALMVSTELARLVLSIREICGIEDQTGKRRTDFTYSEESFVALSLRPHGKIWIAIAPVEDIDEEKAPLIREDALC